MQPDPTPADIPVAQVAAAVLLTLLVTAAGFLTWPAPEWTGTPPWLLAGVPGPLWALVGGAAVACVLVATALTAAPAGLRWGDLRTALWLGVVLAAAAALVWNALYAASLSTIAFGAVIPVFHWLFTLVPALLAGLLFAHRGPAARRAAALGTGVVTLPLFHLSWVLLDAGSGGSPLEALWPTLVLGALPLALAARAGGSPRSGAVTPPT